MVSYDCLGGFSTLLAFGYFLFVVTALYVGG